MRTAIRTAPYDSNEQPKIHDLPQRVKVWLRGDDPACEELQYFESYEIAGRLEDFYRHEIDKGRSFRQSFPWSCPLKAMGSDAVLVFHDIRQDSEGKLRDLQCKVVKRTEFEKAYIISEPDGSFKTYVPKPADTSDVSLSTELLALSEKIAEHVHDTWAEQRIADGWRFGPCRDDEKKWSPCLVPYDKLPNNEKEYDRQTALGTIKLILKLGGRIEFQT